MTFSMSFYTDSPNRKSSLNIQSPVISAGDCGALNPLVYSKVQSFAAIHPDYFPEDSAMTVDYQAAVALLNDNKRYGGGERL